VTAAWGRDATRPKVVSFEAGDRQREYLSARLVDVEHAFSGQPLDVTTAEVAGDADIVTVFIRSSVDRATLDRLPRLKLVATRSTGFDHVDVAACHERGIAVTNVPRYGENTVAEHTFGLLLSLTRHIHQATRRTARGDYSIHGLEGIDLKGRVLGVVGAGSIGLHVIRIAKGFGMEVVAFDARPHHLLAEVLGFTYLSLEELLRQAEIVTLHVPLLPTTHHLMNRDRFAMMRRGSYLLNTSRGAIVDTDALLWALDEGILAGAGLDVIEGEELVGGEEQLLATAGVEDKLRMVVRQHLLLQRENVVLTPHIGFYSKEAEERILQVTIDNIVSFLDGRPQNVVTLSAGGKP